MVPVAGTEADAETVKLACRLAHKGKSKILAIHVIPIGRTLPLDAELAAEVRKAKNILGWVEKVERQVDLIVMGLTYKRYYGQFSLGNVTPYVLKNAPCPVILYQQYQPERV